MSNINIRVREVNSEVLVFIDRNMPDELSALREAAKILAREVLYRESHPDNGVRRKSNGNLLP